MSTIRAIPEFVFFPQVKPRRDGVAQAAPALQARARWGAQDFAAAAAFAIAGVLVTGNAWLDLASAALDSEELGYILLVPLLTAWLAWVRRERLAFCRSHGQWCGPLLAATGLVCYALGDAWMIDTLWYGGALLLPIAGAVSVFGRDVLKAFVPAFLAMAFCIPMPGSLRQTIAGPLQEVTAITTEMALVMLGTPVSRSGNLLTINGHAVAIAEACNGLRMAIPLMLVCYAYAFAMPLRNWVRAALLLVAPLFAVVCNMIRMMPTAWAYGYASPEFADQFHDLAGWGMLLVSALLVMGAIRVLQWIGLAVFPYRFGEGAR